ncbi:hypothetical protein [Jeotgalibacillus marinus]|uniref:Uncharacterized protein n=1 Tax=Jeotgalibacillus marinus TaxID=86667 RepID=A0ABV3Q465_9BACL
MEITFQMIQIIVILLSILLPIAAILFVAWAIMKMYFKMKKEHEK